MVIMCAGWGGFSDPSFVIFFVMVLVACFGCGVYFLGHGDGGIVGG